MGRGKNMGVSQKTCVSQNTTPVVSEARPVVMASNREARVSSPRVAESAAEAGNGQSVPSCGAFAQELIQRQIRRLGKLQAEVIADRDPEPLHQLRVSLRRLRTAVGQFTPALELPDGVSERRLAAVARRTSLCRDLDVLQQRLREQLLPQLPDGEQRRLEGAMRRLKKDRQQAFESMVEALRGGRYLKLLARLHKWQKRPRFTPLGEQPLVPWLSDLQAPFSAGLFLHPGWRVDDPSAEALHGLRKRIKQARYSLEGLQPWCTPAVRSWIEELKQAQDDLGDLHDLQVLSLTLMGHESLRKTEDLPVLHAELAGRQQRHWLRWRELAQRLQDDGHRNAIQRQLADMSHTCLAECGA
jgi:CHAD domain-containing protein